MNKVEVKVHKIRSYQTLVYKNGNRSFKTKVYKDYIKEVSLQLGKLKPLPSKIDIGIEIEFKHKNRVKPDIDNATKPILDILQICEKIVDDRQIVDYHAIQTFGHKENSIVIKTFIKETTQ